MLVVSLHDCREESRMKREQVDAANRIEEARQQVCFCTDLSCKVDFSCLAYLQVIINMFGGVKALAALANKERAELEAKRAEETR